MSFIVIVFVISRDQYVGWQKAMLSQLVDLVKTHPSGNVIRFGEMWCTPDLTSPDSLTSFHKPFRNFFPMYKVINTHIKNLMKGSGSRSIYGAISNHVGMTGSQKNWISDAWEGYVPTLKGSLKFCHKLTPPIRKLDLSRSLELLRVRPEPSPMFELSRSYVWSTGDGKVGV